MLKKWKAKRAAKKKRRMRDRLARDLWFCHENDNRGVLLRCLASMPGVAETTFDTGGWRDCSAEVVMRDGFTIVEYGRRPRHAIRKAAQAVVERLKDVSSLR